MKHIKIASFWLIAILFVVMVLGIGGEALLRAAGYRDAFFDPRYKIDGLTTPDHFTFDPKTGYAMIPNIRDRQRGISTDPFGDRITTWSTAKHRRSIVLVGESSVFGWGVRDEPLPSKWRKIPVFPIMTL